MSYLSPLLLLIWNSPHTQTHTHTHTHPILAHFPRISRLLGRFVVPLAALEVLVVLLLQRYRALFAALPMSAGEQRVIGGCRCRTRRNHRRRRGRRQLLQCRRTWRRCGKFVERGGIDVGDVDVIDGVVALILMLQMRLVMVMLDRMMMMELLLVQI